MFGNSRRIESPVMVLPQPLSPTMPTRSPGAMSKSILRVACQTPCEVLKRMPRPRTDISACGPPAPLADRALCRAGPPPSAGRPLLLFHQLLLHQHLGSDDAVARQLIDLGLGKAEQAARIS